MDHEQWRNLSLFKDFIKFRVPEFLKSGQFSLNVIPSKSTKF